MSDLVLHIGMPKTGTTAIQHVLSHNQEVLAASGIVYRGWDGPDRSHNYVARWVHDDRREEIRTLFHQLAETPGDRVVVSCGPLFCLTSNQAKRRMDERLLERLEQREADAIDRLAHIAHEYFARVTVLVYIRRQDLALESAYNQSVKNRSWHGGDIHHFHRYYGPTLEYDRVLERWARAFGARAIDVRVFEPASLIDGDAVTDFCQAIGVARQDLDQPERDHRAANIRLPRDVFEYKRALNRIPMRKFEERQAKWALRAVARDMDLDPRRWSGILGVEERQRLLGQYLEANRVVMTRFLGAESKRLFDDLPGGEHTPADPYPGLSPETGLEIHLRFQRIWNSPRYRWDRLRTRIGGTFARWPLRPLAMVRRGRATQ